MKYLFFDLEFATSDGGSKICEFGYVITDEHLQVKERNNIIIDPNIYRYEWDSTVVNSILTRGISEYERSPFFPQHYDRIVSLIQSADYIVGHTMSSDAKALNDDCKRYHKDSIDFEFYDIKEMYKEFSNTTKNVSVVNLLKELNVSLDEAESKSHDAENDAYNTMLELKAMLKSLDMSLPEFIELCPCSKFENKDYIVHANLSEKDKKEQEYLASLEQEGGNDIPELGESRRRFQLFIGRAIPSGEGENKLKGKKVCFGYHYESHHFRQMLNLIQLIVNEGGYVTYKPGKCNVFVQYDAFSNSGELLYDKRYNTVKKLKEERKKIEIVAFSDFLSQLHITEEQLDAMPMISFDYLKTDFVNPNANLPQGSSIGELLLAKGIDLSKLFQE